MEIDNRLKEVTEKFKTGLCPSKIDVFMEIKKVLPDINDKEAMLQTYRIISNSYK